MKHFITLFLVLCFCLPLHTQAQEFTLPVTFTAGSQSTVLTIGTHPNATDDFDVDLDVLAPPSPPSAAINAWSAINNENYQTDLRSISETELQFSIGFQADPGSDITLSWDSAPLATLGSFEITDDVTGTQFGPVDMTATNSFSLSEAGGQLNTGLRISVVLGNVGVSNEMAGETPDQLILAQNYPNPFAASTSISFTTAVAGQTHVAVFNVLGQEVKVLLDGVLPAGSHQQNWTPGDVPGGVYFYRVTQANGTSRTGRMLLVK
ncbi:MAG: T9SS type A sorting domain-containing protein [Bacteroidota bacterium]